MTEKDMYEVTDWEERTFLDRIAVWLYGHLSSKSILLLGIFSGLILIGQFAFAGMILFERPGIASLILFSMIPGAIIFYYVHSSDNPTREPLSILTVTFALGGLLAGFASMINSIAGPLIEPLPVFGAAIFFMLFVGPIEEAVKWAAVRLYSFNLDDFDHVIDGAVYGAAAGLGFASVENLVYIAREIVVTAATNPAGLRLAGESIAVSRSLAGPAHVLFSALAGYYLGLAKFNRENYGPIVVKGLLIAAFMHGLYNTAITYMPQLIEVNQLSFLAFILVFNGVMLALVFGKLSRYNSAMAHTE